MSNVDLHWSNPITGKAQATGLSFDPDSQAGFRIVFNLYQMPQLFNLTIDAILDCIEGKEETHIPVANLFNLYVNLLWLETVEHKGIEGFDKSLDFGFIERMSHRKVRTKIDTDNGVLTNEYASAVDYKDIHDSIKLFIEGSNRKYKDITPLLDSMMQCSFGIHWRKDVSNVLSFDADTYQNFLCSINDEYQQDSSVKTAKNKKGEEINKYKEKFKEKANEIVNSKISEQDRHLLINQGKIYRGVLYNAVARKLFISLNHTLKYSEDERFLFKVLHFSIPYPTELNPRFEMPPAMSLKAFREELIPNYIRYKKIDLSKFMLLLLFLRKKETLSQVMPELTGFLKWYMGYYDLSVPESNYNEKTWRRQESYSTSETEFVPKDAEPSVYAEEYGIVLDGTCNYGDAPFICPSLDIPYTESFPRWDIFISKNHFKDIEEAKKAITDKIKPRKGVDVVARVFSFLEGDSLQQIATKEGAKRQSVTQSIEKVLNEFGLSTKDLT